MSKNNIYLLETRFFVEIDQIISVRIIGENPFSAYIPSPDGGIFLSDRILRSLRSFAIDSYEKLSTTPPFRTSASTLSLPTPPARIADDNEKSGSVALPPLRSDRNRPCVPTAIVSLHRANPHLGQPRHLARQPVEIGDLLDLPVVIGIEDRGT